MKLVFSVILICLLSNTVIAGDKSNQLYVRSPSAIGCFDIHESDSCFDVPQGGLILTTKEQARIKAWKTNEWFEVKTGSSIKPPWWIKSEFLFHYDDFVKASEDWCVKSLKYDSGDSRLEFFFEENGDVVYKHTNYKGVSEYKGNVYVDNINTPKLVQIRYLNPKYGELAYTYRFNSKKNEINLRSVCIPGEYCEQNKRKNN